MVPTDDEQRMDVDELAGMVAADRADGLVPFFVCATVGIDVDHGVRSDRGDLRRGRASSDLWVHLDAAFAGSATVCPEYRWIIDGVERVDSYCFNPHKWLLTNFDCSAFWVARPRRSARRLVDPARVPPERGDRRPAPSWTTATGRCRWAGGSAPSSCGS